MTREKHVKHRKSLALGCQLLLDHYYNDFKDVTQKINPGYPAKILRHLTAIGSQVLDYLQIENLHFLIGLTHWEVLASAEK